MKALKHLIGTVLLTTLALTSCTSPPLPDNIDKLPYSELEDRKMGGWSNAEIIDDTHIRITIETTGAPDCYRDETEVVETPTTITVTAFHGWIPHSDRLCPDAMFYGTDTVTMVVETKEPINGRKIIDGGSKFYADLAEKKKKPNPVNRDQTTESPRDHPLLGSLSLQHEQYPLQKDGPSEAVSGEVFEKKTIIQRRPS